MKKFVVFLLCILSFTSLLAPFSAFAEGINSDDAVSSPINEYGVLPFNSRMIVRARSVYSNDASNVEYIQKQHDDGFTHYDGEFDANRFLGTILCFDIPASDDGSFTDTQKAFYAKACSAWSDRKNHLLVYYRNSNDNYISAFYYYFYTGEKTINLDFLSASRSGFDFKGFVAHLEPEDYNDFYVVSGFVDSRTRYCSPDERVGLCSEQSIDVRVGYDNLYSPSLKFPSPNQKAHPFFGYNTLEGYFIPVFTTFNVNYPEDYPDSDKVSNNIVIEKTQKVFKPYFWHQVKDKNMKGQIQPYFTDGSGVGEDGVNGRIKPRFELYREDQITKLFQYDGSTLNDKFNYDFEEYGVYYMKTSVSWAVSGFGVLKNEELPIVDNPIWTKVVIDGGSYTSMINPTNPKECVGNTCGLPDYAQTCSVKFDDLGGVVSCEYTRLRSFFVDKMGFLYLPVSILERFVSNVSKTSSVSCAINMGSGVGFDVCFIQNRTPGLYSFLVMVMNGFLLFAFVLFLRQQLVGFVNDKGDE